MDYFGNELKPFKANLHTHSTTSDGKFEPEKVIQLYAEAGYDVLAFTDRGDHTFRGGSFVFS